MSDVYDVFYFTVVATGLGGVVVFMGTAMLGMIGFSETLEKIFEWFLMDSIPEDAPRRVEGILFRVLICWAVGFLVLLRNF